MMENKLNLEENAKEDWMKLVKKHKKRQKGLAITSLNPNAGNVEHNINMFNMMNRGVAPDVNPVSGPFSSDGDSVGVAIGESVELRKEKDIEYLTNLMNDLANESVELEYKSLKFSIDLGGGDSVDRNIYWTYVVSMEDIVEFIYHECLSDSIFEYIEHLPGEGRSWIYANFDDLFYKYQEQILENWQDDAIDNAIEYYDPLAEHLNTLDDDFDMSMRTLL